MRKILSLRLFNDEQKNWAKSVVEMDYEILLLSQFTLMGKTCQGAKLDFHNSMPTEAAREEFARTVECFKAAYRPERVKCKLFGFSF